MGPIRLIIADDDPGIRDALRMIAQDLGAEIIAEADNGRAAIKEAELHHPQIMLLDASMPIMGGFPAAKYLHEHLPDLRVILVSQHNLKAYAEEALEIGAKGYLVKAAVVRELGLAIRPLWREEHLFHPPLATDSVEQLEKIVLYTLKQSGNIPRAHLHKRWSLTWRRYP
jgi:DNA-binding NarL/FixJ family response regulator